MHHDRPAWRTGQRADICKSFVLTTMSERPAELQSTLNDVRRRWMRRAMLRAWTLGAAAATTVLLVGLITTAFIARDGVPLVFTSAVVLITALAGLGWSMWPYRRGPTDRQLARFIEERNPQLDDIVVTAVDYAARPQASSRMRDALQADAARAMRDFNLDAVVSRDSIRQHAFRAAAATAALAVSVAFFAPGLTRAT